MYGEDLGLNMSKILIFLHLFTKVIHKDRSSTFEAQGMQGYADLVEKVG